MKTILTLGLTMTLAAPALAHDVAVPHAHGAEGVAAWAVIAIVVAVVAAVFFWRRKAKA